MAIYVPGKRDRHNRPLRNSNRNVIVMLSLTAMVDMFTVLVVFLLQNYQTTGEVIDISDDVVLPKAGAVKELRPAHVVVVSKEKISLDKDMVASFVQVKEQVDWKIDNLFNLLKERFRLAEEKRKSLGLGRIRDVVTDAKDQLPADPTADDRRVTVQVDKSIDFLTVKKIMFTVTEAGASEINFAVMKDEEKAN